MESSWRRGVWEAGVVLSGATLCSHLHDFPEVSYATNTPTDPGMFIRWYVPGDNQPVMQPAEGVKVIGHPRFPYGWEVDPDLHT